MEVPDPARPNTSRLRSSGGTVESRRSRVYAPLRTYSAVTRTAAPKEKLPPIFFSADCNGAPQDVFRPTIKIRDLGSGNNPVEGPPLFVMIPGVWRLDSMLGETRGILDIKPSLNCAGRGDYESWSCARGTLLNRGIPVKTKRSRCGKAGEFSRRWTRISAVTARPFLFARLRAKSRQVGERERLARPAAGNPAD